MFVVDPSMLHAATPNTRRDLTPEYRRYVLFSTFLTRAPRTTCCLREALPVRQSSFHRKCAKRCHKNSSRCSTGQLRHLRPQRRWYGNELRGCKHASALLRLFRRHDHAGARYVVHKINESRLCVVLANYSTRPSSANTTLRLSTRQHSACRLSAGR